MASKTFWIINQTAGSPYHGMVYRNYYIAREWVRQGHKAVIISASNFHNFHTKPKTNGLFTKEMIDGIEYWWVKLPNYSQSRSLGRLFMIFLFPFLLILFPFWRLKRPDTIIVSGPPHLPIFQTWLWSRIYHATLVYEIRDIWPLTIQKLGNIPGWHPLILVLSFFERMAYQVSDRVVSVLSLAWRHCEPKGMKPVKFAYIPNGIDLTGYKLIPSNTGDQIAQISKNKFTVIYAGSFGIANHLHQLMDVAKSMSDMDDVAFVLLGDGPHKQHLMEQAKDLKNVFFFPYVPKEQVPYILQQADVGFIGFVKTDLYQYGVSPNKIFDYMAAELPILMVLDSEDDIIERAQAGVTVRTDDAPNIRQGILDLKNLSVDALEQLGKNGRKFLEKNHVYDALAARYVKIAEEGRRPVEEATRWALSPFWLGFYFVMLSGLFFHKILPIFFPELFRNGMTVFLQDIHLFHHWAIDLGPLSWSDWWNAKMFMPAKVMSFIYRVTGVEQPFMFLPVLAALAGLTLRLLASILDILGVKGRWWPLIIAFIFTVTPTSFSWMIYPHKDAFIIPGFLLVVWVLLATTIHRPRFRHIPALLLGLVLFLSDKPYFAQILAAGIILAFIPSFLEPAESLRRIGRVCVFAFTLSVVYWVSLGADNYGAGVENIPKEEVANIIPSAIPVQPTVQHVDRHKEAMTHWVGFGGPRIFDVPFQRMIYTRERFLSERAHGDTNFMPEIIIKSAWESVGFFPYVLRLAFLEPVPWRSQWDKGIARGLVFFALQLEMILFYGLLLCLLISGRKMFRAEILICLCIALPFLIALGYAMPNIGSINRYRFPFLLLIKLAGFAALWAADRQTWPGRLLMWIDPPKLNRKKKIVLFLVPDDATFIVQRLVMARSVQEGGYDVHVACPDLGHAQKIRDLGFTHHNVELNRGGLNPFADVTAFIRLVFFLAKLRPDILQNVSIKPVVYGSTAATIVGVRRVVNLVNGMGYAFDKNGIKGTIVYYIAVGLYRNALAMSGLRVIFQNPTDRQYFIDHNLVEEKKTLLIRGSGVDMKKFAPSPLPNDPVPTVLFVGRLLWSKGVKELIDAAEIVRQKGHPFRLIIVGEPDDRNPGAVPRSVLQKWHEDGVVEWVGRQTDMPSFYRKADVVCLPTNYREGLPLTLLEAASMGRPLIATDMPGCREVVIHNQNGLLVPTQNTEALAEALLALVSNRELRERFGQASSKLVEAEFSSHHVKRQLLAVYESLYQVDSVQSTTQQMLINAASQHA